VSDIELRDWIALGSVLLALASMVIVSRNARRATSVNAQTLDLARIRDLRQELKETRDELDKVKAQTSQLSLQLTEANAAALEAYRERAEMLRYAQMPGMDIETWLRRFSPPQLGGTIQA
jgi:septal ring factor EnvC (AmiA/AmiB activator)